jgi:hypothetical protein
MRSALFIVLLAGCMTESGQGLPLPIDPEPELTPQERAWVDHALPVLQARCGTCHSDEGSAIGWLAGDTALEKRETFIASGVVDFDAEPGNQRIFTKGLHSGPALSALETSSLLEWFQTERLLHAP